MVACPAAGGTVVDGTCVLRVFAPRVDRDMSCPAPASVHCARDRLLDATLACRRSREGERVVQSFERHVLDDDRGAQAIVAVLNRHVQRDAQPARRLARPPLSCVCLYSSHTARKFSACHRRNSALGSAPLLRASRLENAALLASGMPPTAGYETLHPNAPWPSLSKPVRHTAGRVSRQFSADRHGRLDCSSPSDHRLSRGADRRRSLRPRARVRGRWRRPCLLGPRSMR
jgi:hypothetical protein